MMIVSNTSQPSAAVALHYDELDPFYRDIWGDHVHHGYWRTGRETPLEATEALSKMVAARLGLQDGMVLCDIGCGYGATARLFASHYAVAIKGITISQRQFEAASARLQGGVSITNCDWLRNDFANASFDAAYAIESSEHIEDKARFFAEALRVLRPGARFVVCAWIASSKAMGWQERHLLEPICRHGRLPGMGREEDYRGFASAAGFTLVSLDDISARVKRTWAVCLRRLLRKLFTDSRYAAFLLARGSKNRMFALTLLYMMAAYETGALRYCVFTFQKPA